MINAEMLEARREESVPPPTTLHLFRFKEAERLDLQPRVNSIEQFVNSAKKALESVEKLQITAKKRIDSLLKTNTELDQQAARLAGSASCGAIFLRMRDELPNLSSKELADFFKLCLGIYDHLYDKYVEDDLFDQGNKTSLWRKLVADFNNPKGAFYQTQCSSST